LAQDNADQRYDQVLSLLKSSAAEITDNSLTDVRTLADWNQVRPQRKREFMYMLGLEPLPKRTPLNAAVTGTLDREAYRVEKVVFQSMPGLYVTGNFYLPKNSDSPLPTILYVCGHSPHPLGAKWNYQDRAQWFAENGYACLVIDTLEFGEVAGIHHGLHNLNMWRWISTGYTPAGVEVWNAMRAIDYLETREEVDPNRIGITGISGGGAMSWYAAAADERIAVSVPVCGTFTFGSQAKNWLADGQCDCIYFNNTYHSDLPAVAALIAPRPLLMCSGIRDSIFPPDGYHEVYHQTKRIYDLHAKEGAESDRIKEVDDNVPHQDSPLLRKETRQWLNRWLKEDMTSLEIVPNPKGKAIDASDLACLTKLPGDATNYGIHDTFIETAELKNYENVSRWTSRRKQLLTELHDKTFRWFPTTKIPFKAVPNGGYGGWADRYAEYKDMQIQTEVGSFIRVQLLKARQREEPIPLLIYVERSSDNLSAVDIDELLPLLGRCDVAIVNTRLTDRTLTSAEFTNIERTAAWVGRTIAAMQTWDIIRVHQWLTEEESLSPSLTVVLAKDEMTVPAIYATLLDDGIEQVIVRNLPSSHRHAPPLLNVLRFTDIPEVAAALSPRRLTFLGKRSADFMLTENVYAITGSADKLTNANSVAAALEMGKRDWKSKPPE